MTEIKNIAAALAKAQANMSRALKQSNNPHFRSKYADLGNVMDACMPSLTEQGIAVVQPTIQDETGRYVETILMHGESGETLSCRVPLIVAKNDMQGFGSAVTYARRYGLMTMAGIAPEDDDGNAAAKSPPGNRVQKTITPGQYIQVRDKAQEAGVKEDVICNDAGCQDLQMMPANQFDRIMKRLQQTIDGKMQSKPSDIDDSIPNFEEASEK
jgi:hypothetical protein